MEGIIIKIISNDCTVFASGISYVCKPRGIFRKHNIVPLVGDKVLFYEKDQIITEILPRKNELIRPKIANVDCAFIIVSVKKPDLDLNLLDKLLVTIEYNNIVPVICLTKLDLLDNKENILKIRKYYEKIGYLVFENTKLEEIRKYFNNKTIVFTGQSGAGKSTLLNMLSENLNIKTNEISLALGRGKHTTRHVELISMFGGNVADTPGFSSLDFHDMTNLDIRDNFIDFNLYRDMCKYKDCMHDKDDNCIIKEKVLSGDILKSRYENYLKFISREK